MPISCICVNTYEIIGDIMTNSELIFNVERAIQHDNHAIEALYQYTYSRMYALVYGLCRNKNDIEDILQEGYTTAFLKLNTLQEKGAFYNWLRKIMINSWREYSRSASAKPANDTYEMEHYNLEARLMEPSPYDVVEDSIIREQIFKMLDNLPENQRICMILYYYDNMTMEEIADALEIPLGSVKSRLYYGRKKLGNAIKEENLFSINLLMSTTAADSASVLAKVLATLEGTSKGTVAATAAKTAGSGLVLKWGIGLISIASVAGITGAIVYPYLTTPQNRPSIDTTPSVPIASTTAITTTTTTATTASTTAAAFELTIETTTVTPAPTAPTTAAPFVAFQYQAVSGGIALTKYTGSESNLSIPGEIDGQRVVAIGDKAFAYCTVLKSVTIPDSVKSVGIDAFRECDNLTSVNFGSGVTSIGDMAFVGCESLPSVTLPPSVRSVGIYAFAYCTSLERVVMAEGTQTIRYNVFYDCSNLRSVTLPASVSKIGADVFTGTSPNLVLSVPSGSYAQAYAEEKGFSYISS